MRFVVFGAGAVGGVVGARLADAGHEVVLVARGAHLAAIRRDGLRVVAPDSELRVRVDAVGDPSEIAWRDGDVALLAVKSQDTGAALRALADVAPDELPVVCVQNGVANERAALRHFEHVYGVCVVCPALHLEAGVVEQHAAPTAGILDIGRYPSGTDDLTGELAAAFSSATFASEVRPDIMRWKYGKLLNTLGNSIDALCGAEARSAGELAGRVRAEGEAVLAAAGIDHVSQEEDAARRGDLFQWGGAAARSRKGASSWQSLARRTGSIEADFLNGEVVLLGRLHGVPTPANQLLQRLANRAAREGREPGTLDPADVIRMLDPGE